VTKRSGPWTPAVAALLRHLDAAGFAGAPRAAGDAAYTYVPGSSPHPRAWPDEAVAGVGVLLRDLPGSDPVYGHCDTGPWNIVGSGGRPDAFIDWEFAGPVDRLWELAETVWLNAQLHDDDVAERHGLPDAAARMRQARAIVDGYGLAAGRRADLVDRIQDVAIHAARAEAVAYAVTPESTAAVSDDGVPVLWAVAWRARSASWIARHRAQLRRAIR
jgi:hypothetical protein